MLEVAAAFAAFGIAAGRRRTWKLATLRGPGACDILPRRLAGPVATCRSEVVLGAEPVPGRRPVVTGAAVSTWRAIIIRHRMPIRRCTIVARRTMALPLAETAGRTVAV